MNVSVDPENYEYIPAKKPADYYDTDTLQRVAIYVRVSTDDIRQTTSYELQKKYYEDFCGKTKTDKSYVFKWLPIIAAANLTKQRPEEKELLESWLNISDHM